MNRTAVALTMLAVACAADPSPETLERRLLDADRAFLQATIDDGLEGWLSFFTNDAVRFDLHGDTVAGLAAIRQADAALFEPDGLRLRWEPQHAVSFAGGREGLTRGRYTLVLPVGDGEESEVVDRGSYLTLWRLEGGRYRVYLDVGSPDSGPEDLIH